MIDLPDEVGEVAADLIDAHARRNGRPAGRVSTSVDTPTTVETDEDYDPVASWHPVDLAGAIDGTDVPPRRLVQRTDGEGLFYASCLNAAQGLPESAKTWLTFLGAVQVIRAGGHVVLVDFEGGTRETASRLKALGLTRAEILNQFHFIAPGDPITFGAVDLVAELRPELVIVDSMTEWMDLHGLDPYKSTDVSRVHKWFRRLADHGAAVVVIDHVIKSGDGRGNWAIGSERKISGLGGSAIGFEVRAPFARGRHGIARLTVAKDRPGYVRGIASGAKVVGEFHLRPGDPMAGEPEVIAEVRPPESAAEGDGAGFRPTQVMDKARALLAEHPEGLSKNAIRTTLGGRKEYVDLALELLVGDGAVTLERGERGAIVHRLGEDG